MKAILTVLAVAAAIISAWAITNPAAAASSVSQKVAACDPDYPNRCIKPAADGSIPTTPSFTAATSTNGSSTVATGGTFQTALASSATRTGCLVQNPTTATEALYVSMASSPTTANSYSLAPGASFSCASGAVVVTDAIKVTAVTTSHAFTLYSQ